MSEDKTQVRVASGNLMLKGVKGTYRDQLFEVNGALSIGREPNCDLVVTSNLISRQHASIARENDVLLLTDNNSSNGSYVNGKKVQSCRLNAGDKLVFGSEEFSVVFKPDDYISAEPVVDNDTTVVASRLDSDIAMSETEVMDAIVIADHNSVDNQQAMVAPAIAPDEQQTIVAPAIAVDDQQTIVASAAEMAAVKDADKTMVGAPAGSAQPPPAIKTPPAASVGGVKVVELVGRMAPVAGRVFLLNKPLLTVGRSPFNDIILKAESVSSHHAEIECQDGRWWVRDLYSSNGSYVNGMRIEEQELLPGDIVMFGELALDFDPSNKDVSPAGSTDATVAESKNTVGLIVAAAVGGFVVAMLAAYLLLL